MWTESELQAKPRNELQALAKARGIRANSKSSTIIEHLLDWVRANRQAGEGAAVTLSCEFSGPFFWRVL